MRKKIVDSDVMLQAKKPLADFKNEMSLLSRGDVNLNSFIHIHISHVLTISVLHHSFLSHRIGFRVLVVEEKKERSINDPIGIWIHILLS